MTCCIEDVTFIGFKCKYDREEELPHKSWITITAEIRVEFAREYKGKGPVLYPVSIEKAQKPEDELVYFRKKSLRKVKKSYTIKRCVMHLFLYSAEKENRD